jgi:hypothetical protein
MFTLCFGIIYLFEFLVLVENIKMTEKDDCAIKQTSCMKFSNLVLKTQSYCKQDSIFVYVDQSQKHCSCC